MREIRFKYTCKRSNSHTFSQVFTLEEIQYGSVSKWMEVNIISFSQLSIDRFTGLKDKNGVDIYEGDMVDLFNETFEIVNRHGCFYHKHLTGEAYGSMHDTHYPYKELSNDNYYTVIGNTHQSASKPV